MVLVIEQIAVSTYVWCCVRGYRLGCSGVSFALSPPRRDTIIGLHNRAASNPLFWVRFFHFENVLGALGWAKWDFVT